MRDNEKRSVDQSRDHDKYPVDVAGRQVTENENQHRKRGGQNPIRSLIKALRSTFIMNPRLKNSSTKPSPSASASYRPIQSSKCHAEHACHGPDQKKDAQDNRVD